MGDEFDGMCAIFHCGAEFFALRFIGVAFSDGSGFSRRTLGIPQNSDGLIIRLYQIRLDGFARRRNRQTEPETIINPDLQIGRLAQSRARNLNPHRLAYSRAIGGPGDTEWRLGVRRLNYCGDRDGSKRRPDQPTGKIALHSASVGLARLLYCTPHRTNPSFPYNC